MDISQINIVKRDVKYPRLELKTGQPFLILPKNGNFDPEEIINKHKEWLKRKLEYIKKLERKYQNRKLYQRSKEELIDVIQRWVQRYSKILGVKPQKFTLRLMKTRWGSCSKRMRLTFNLLLRHLPDSLIEYVVFHEMVHLLVPNHKKRFWQLVKQQFSQPERYEEALFGYWFILAKREFVS